VTGEKGNGLIRKYGLNVSRQAFREKAEEMGWKKVCVQVFVLPQELNINELCSIDER